MTQSEVEACMGTSGLCWYRPSIAGCSQAVQISIMMVVEVTLGS